MMLQATNETFQNASQGLNGGVANSFGLVGPVIGVLLIAVLAVFVGSSVSRIQWVHEKLQAFSETLYYTAVGLASTVVLGVVVAPLYLLSQADGQTQAYVGYAIVGLVLAYGVFTALGYVVDRYLLETWREYQAEHREQSEDDVPT